MKLRKFFLLFLTSGILYACTPASKGQSMNPRMSIELGENAIDFSSKSPVTISKECYKNTGLCFYAFSDRYSSSTLPVLTFKHGAHSLIFEHVAGFTAIETNSIDGIEDIDISPRSLTDNTPHEDNRLYVYKLIAQLKQSGWKPMYFHSQARIPPTPKNITVWEQMEGGKYKNKDGFYPTDPTISPNYVMTQQQWLDKMPFLESWHFYADGVYLSLMVNCWPSDNAPQTHGTYNISYKITSEKSYYLPNFEDNEKTPEQIADDKVHWKERLPAILKKEADERYKAETQARALGFQIDSAYQDPTINALASR